MNLYPELSNDWALPYPFRVLRLESEHDAELGQWYAGISILGFGLSLTWVYDPANETRQSIKAAMDDPDWLINSRVCLPYAEYAEMKANADIGAAYLRYYEKEEEDSYGFDPVWPSKVHDAIMADVESQAGTA